MVVTDGKGTPIGLHVDSAQRAEVKLAQTTLGTVRVHQPKGRPRTRPDYLTADKGYDSREFRQYLHRRGIRHSIPPIIRTGRWRSRRLPQYDPTRYAQRWIVERSNAWLQNFRRVLVRHERLLPTYRAFVFIACLLIALRALSK